MSIQNNSNSFNTNIEEYTISELYKLLELDEFTRENIVLKTHDLTSNIFKNNEPIKKFFIQDGAPRCCCCWGRRSVPWGSCGGGGRGRRLRGDLDHLKELVGELQDVIEPLGRHLGPRVFAVVLYLACGAIAPCGIRRPDTLLSCAR